MEPELEIAGAKGIAKDETPFERLSADFDVVKGTAGTKDLEFRSQDLDADGAGTVGLGGALVDAALVAKGDWNAITERARRVTDAVAEARARQGAKT